MSRKLAGLLLPALLLLVAVTQSDCARNPVTGKRQLVLLSEAQEIEVGKASHPEILSEFGRVDDAALQDYIQRIGSEIAGVSHRPDLPWTFTVVDTPVVNAFALPGGYIYVTREILAYMNNEAELAGVLGHEAGHVTARHGVTQVSRAQLFGLALGVGSIFSSTVRQVGDLAQIGAGLLLLKYGRDAERQSDQLGVEYMYDVGYDPREMSQFFRVFERMREESGQVLPNWLSSHPAPPDRIEATRALAEQLMEEKPRQGLRVQRDDYLSKIDNSVFGENPREGFTEGGRFLHPDLRFQIQYPDGWKVRNTRSSVVFTEPDGQAGVQLTLAPPQFAGSPESRAQAVAREAGASLVSGRATRINGNPAYLAVLSASDPQGGTQQALAAFISYGSNLYELLGAAAPAVYSRYTSTLEQIMTSFRSLNDRRYLDVQPDRLRIHRAGRGETLRSLAQRYPHPRMDLEDLADLNRIDPDQALEPGRLVKVVEAGR